MQDDILRKLIYTGKRETIDLVNPDLEVSTLSIQDVPGGTVSFLFEKSSTAALEDPEGEEG